MMTVLYNYQLLAYESAVGSGGCDHVATSNCLKLGKLSEIVIKFTIYNIASLLSFEQVSAHAHNQHCQQHYKGCLYGEKNPME